MSEELTKFVREICKDRDASHGLSHMERVTKTTLFIFNMMDKHHDLLKLVMTVAWLHDVPDHKYDKNKLNYYKMIKFLQENDYTETEIKLISNIIPRISYSREAKVGSDDWKEILGEKGLFIRNVVSDADKLDAIGKFGLQRCIDFYEHKNMSKENILSEIKLHTKDKLIKLKDHYIRTEYGKQLAKTAHSEFMKKYNKMTS